MSKKNKQEEPKLIIDDKEYLESDLTEPQIRLLNMAKYLEPQISCLLYTSPRPRDVEESRMPSSA